MKNQLGMNELLIESLRCLVKVMEQNLIREHRKCVDHDEPKQDHIAMCLGRGPHECSNVDDCLDRLYRLNRGFEELCEHENLMHRKFKPDELEVAHICDMIYAGIGHGFPDDLVACARELYDVAKRALPAKALYSKSDTLCDHVVKYFQKRADEVIDKHGCKTWLDGMYSLPLAYLGNWMKKFYWNEKVY